MIGFRPNESERTEPDIRSEEPAPDPGKEVSPDKPEREIILPTPSIIPTPGPDTVESSPSPEITPIPADIPVVSPPPEISPIEPTEFS